MNTAQLLHENDGTRFVATIRWPGEADWRAERLARGEPCLLILESGAAIPVVDAVLEDWASIAASPAELEARRSAVLQRVAALRDSTRRRTTPMLDLDNVLRLGDRSLILAPIEVRLVRAFLESPGSVVSREALVSQVWPDGAPKSNSLSVRLAQLRRRLAPLGLSILTFSNHGYMLEPPSALVAAHEAIA